MAFGPHENVAVYIDIPGRPCSDRQPYRPRPRSLHRGIPLHPLERERRGTNHHQSQLLAIFKFAYVYRDDCLKLELAEVRPGL